MSRPGEGGHLGVVRSQGFDGGDSILSSAWIAGAKGHTDQIGPHEQVIDDEAGGGAEVPGAAEDRMGLLEISCRLGEQALGPEHQGEAELPWTVVLQVNRRRLEGSPSIFDAVAMELDERCHGIAEEDAGTYPRLVDDVPARLALGQGVIPLPPKEALES